MAAKRWRSVMPPPAAYWERATMSAWRSNGARPRPVRMEFAASAIARVRSSRATLRGASHASTAALAGAGIACTVM